MKKVLLSLMLSLFVFAGFATETNKSPIPTEIEETQAIFYPNTRYAAMYNVSNRYVNGVYCYAKWYTVYQAGYALALNNYTGMFDNVYTSISYYFVWTPVGY